MSTPIHNHFNMDPSHHLPPSDPSLDLPIDSSLIEASAAVLASPPLQPTDTLPSTDGTSAIGTNAAAVKPSPFRPRRRPSETDYEVSKKDAIRCLKQYCGDILSNNEIYRRVGVPQRTGRRWLDPASDIKTGPGRTGRPKTVEGDLLRNMIEYVESSEEGRAQLWLELKERFGVKCSAATVKRAMNDAGYQKCKECHKIYRRPDHVDRKSQIVEEHVCIKPTGRRTFADQTPAVKAPIIMEPAYM